MLESTGAAVREPLRVVVMVSGGGTNLQAIIDGVKDGTITNTQIVGVISNNKNAYALKRAEETGYHPGACHRKILRPGAILMSNCWKLWMVMNRILSCWQASL